MTMDQDFPGKVTHCWHVFLYLDRSMERWGGWHNNHQSCWRQRKNLRQKNGKTGKCSKEKNNESTYSFQNYDSRRLLMFLYQGWYLHKEKETSFLTSCIADFGLTATSLFEIWTPAWSSASTGRFNKGSFFFSWQNVTLSFFFGPVFVFIIIIYFVFFFYHRLSSAFDFSMSKDFSINKEFPRVNFVKCAM